MSYTVKRDVHGNHALNYARIPKWLDDLTKDLDYIINNYETPEMLLKRIHSPIEYLRQRYDSFVRDLESQKAYLDKAQESYIRLGDRLNKLNELNKTDMITLNNARIKSLQSISMEKLEKLGEETDYTVPLEDEPLHEILKNQQQREKETNTVGGKRRKNKTKKRKTKINKKR
jgi:hypothetical protein